MATAPIVGSFAYPLTRREAVEKLWSRLLSERSSFDAHWKDISDWLLPRRSRFYSSRRNQGSKTNQNIINSTAKFSQRTLASGMHAGLTSPARPWLKLTTPDPDLADFGPVKEWLAVVTTRILTILAQTNLYNTLPLCYGDFGAFGTSAISILPDSKDLFRARSYPIGSFVLANNERGIANTFIRKYEITVSDLVEQFALIPGTVNELDWSRVSNTVKTLWDRGDYYAPVEVIWAVMPNRLKGQRPGNKGMPFSSCYFEVGDDRQQRAGFLRESGFQTFPVLAPRWETEGEDSYGTDCPGMTALGDIRQLQVMERRKGQAIAKMIDPPMTGPSSLKTQKITLLPGDVTYVDVRDGQQGFKSAHDVNIRLDHLVQDEARVEFRIQRAFYEDLFLMLASTDPRRGLQPPTAREIEERHEEKLLALGPTLERTNDELLDPLIDRVFYMALEAGLFPDPPDELAGTNLKVEYISVLSQAQKLVGIASTDRFLQTMAPLVEMFPTLRHKFNGFEIVDGYADMLSIPPKWVRSTEDAERAASEEQQAQQQAVQAEAARNEAAALRDVSQAQASGGLDALTQGAPL